MYKIDGTTISLTRGDTFIATVSLTKNGTTYTPVQGDTIRFAMKHNVLNVYKTDYVDKNPIIEKNIPIDTMILRIDAADTANLPFGEYVYDMEITYANETVDTFICEAQFNILPEVH